MAPLFFSLGNLLQLMIIPDSEAHFAGQSVLTKTYSIYNDTALRDPRQSKCKEATLHLDRIKDPDYYGYLTLLRPGALFNYTVDGQKQLSDDEAAQLIEQIQVD